MRSVVKLSATDELVASKGESMLRLGALTAVALWSIASGACAQEQSSFSQARAAARTSVHYASSMRGPMPAPPAGVFERISYSSGVGPLGAYVTPNPGDGQRHPAIIWLTGGESNTVGDVWSEAPRENDQNATAYRQAGIVMMFPSLRGGNDNPGQIEGFYGEIDDILAAAEHLASLPYVDPQRIYLGGHSTGGTLVLLTAAASDRFRAVFSFGPVARASSYGDELIPVNFRRLPAWEERSRAPIEWLSSIRSPVLVIEGRGFATNVEDLRAMRAANSNPQVQFIEVMDAGHFSVLAPMNELIARAILADTGAAAAISIPQAEIEAAFRPTPRVQSGPPLVRRPTQEVLNQHFPAVARAAGVEGAATVRCTVQPNFRLDQCEVVREEPPGYGFGDAAILIMREYMEVAPTTTSGESTVGGQLQRQFRWFN